MFNFLKRFQGQDSHSKLKSLIDSINKRKSYIYSANDLSGIEEYTQLKKLSTDDRKAFIFELLDLLHQTFLDKQYIVKRNKHKGFYSYAKEVGSAIISGLLKSKLSYSEEEWTILFEKIKLMVIEGEEVEGLYFNLSFFPIAHIVKQAEYIAKEQELTDNFKNYLNEILEWGEIKNPKPSYYGSDLLKAASRLRALLGTSGEIPPFVLGQDDIGESINAVIQRITKEKSRFDQIFDLASSVSGSKPKAKFSKQIDEHIDAIGPDYYRKVVQELLKIPIKRQIVSKVVESEYSDGTKYNYTETIYLRSPSQIFIKGLVWTCGRFSDKETISLLSSLTEKSYSKIPEIGPAAAALGNACVYILGNMRGKDGLGALSRLKLKVRQNNVKKAIDKHLLEGSKKYNVSVEELKEMAVPDFHLEDGSKILEFGDYSLQVAIDGKRVVQQWIKPDGAMMKSVPSAVKKDLALTKKLSNVRKEVKEIQKVFSAQKQRIDNQFILNRTWDYESFKKYYLNHGLVNSITKKLIWSFTKGENHADAVLLEGQWQTIDHEAFDWIDSETEVKLWHPVNATEGEIVAWREKIIELELRQPIKQAFRELYILTDAEINTRTYSNRMAAHLLKQHQFNSLATIRDWKYSLMGWYDDGRENEICYKIIPEHNIQAEFWIDEINQEDAYNDAGIWLYISTDQVKFKNAETDEVLELAQVPKMVFTEIMRDVDLFVGVSSVGNDPEWMDNNGERQSYRDYWTSYSFGDLNEIAKTRKVILESLLPRLKKIRDKTEIDGKFLRVKGSLRTYKIHIGSSNILMEPNDQYLCIVPSRSSKSPTDKLFIPFEGDRGLSIVLSKAFMLAEDEKITDSTITSQINRAG